MLEKDDLFSRCHNRTVNGASARRVDELLTFFPTHIVLLYLK